jgi:TIR domain
LDSSRASIGIPDLGRNPPPAHVMDTASQHKRAAGVLDVFLSHSSQDKAGVRELALALRKRDPGVLDEDELRPGVPWQRVLEDGIRASASVTALIGKDGLGPRVDEEMQAALRLAVEDERPVIPVILPDAPQPPGLPLFLANPTWVDLRPPLSEVGLDQLVWGTTRDTRKQTRLEVRKSGYTSWLFGGMCR